MALIERIVGVVLAGGRARRMGGGDKCFLSLNNNSLLDSVLERLAPQVAKIVLNANGDASRFARYGLPVVPDPVAGFAGPLAGVLAGMIWAHENHAECRYIMTVAGDTPFFPMDLAQRFLDDTDGLYPAIVLAASNGRRHPVFGLWPVAHKDDLARHLENGSRKILDWSERHISRISEFENEVAGGEEFDPFFNINRKEDLATARRLAAHLAAQKGQHQ